MFGAPPRRTWSLSSSRWTAASFQNSDSRAGCESMAALGRALCRLFFDRREERGPVRGECSCSVALEMLSEGISVDAGVGGRCDGPFRGCVVGFQPLVEGSVVGESEQGFLRDGVDRFRGGQPAQ